MDSAVAQVLSSQARYAAHAAASAGYRFRSLDGDDGYLFEVSDGPRKALFAAGAGSPYALNDARGASLAKDKAFSARMLEDAGLPVIPHRMFFVTSRYADMRAPGREKRDALDFADTATYPLFCKPIAGSCGQFAEAIADRAAFADYLDRVAREHFAILAQPFLRGAEYRVFVLEGRAIFAYRKLAPCVTGDGRATLRDLIAAMPRDHGAPPTHTRGRTAQGVTLSLDDVPAAGDVLDLDGAANRSLGGRTLAPIDDVPAPLASIALEATRVMGLGLAGVDMFDLSQAGDGSDLRIIEVNSNPMVKTLEEHDRWDLIDTIWRANIEAALR